MMDIELLVESPVFYSGVDEDVFFAWIERIEPVGEVRGEGRLLRLKVAAAQLDEDSFRELIAIFKRYALDMKELAKLDLPAFTQWFRNPKAYWHEQVFKRD